MVSREDSYPAQVAIIVKDSSGDMILQRINSVVIRSKYDLDLTKLTVKTAEFVNPLLPVIKEFVDDHNGPLALAMGSDYIV